MKSVSLKIKNLFTPSVRPPSATKQQMVGQAVNQAPVGSFIYFNREGGLQTTPEKLSRIQKLCNTVLKKKPKTSSDVFKKFASGHANTSIRNGRRMRAKQLELHLLQAPRNADGALEMTTELREFVNGVIYPNSKKSTTPEQRPVKLNTVTTDAYADESLVDSSSMSESAAAETAQASPDLAVAVASDSSQTPSIAMKREERKKKALGIRDLQNEFPTKDADAIRTLTNAVAEAERATHDALMSNQPINSAWALLTALPDVESCKTPLEKAYHYIHNTYLQTLLSPAQQDWFVEHYLDLYAEHDKQMATQSKN